MTTSVPYSTPQFDGAKRNFFTGLFSSCKKASRIFNACVLVLLLFFVFGQKSLGQVASYTFSQTQGSTYTSQATGATVLSSSGWDDNVYTTTLPFAFTYNGTTYASGTTIYVNTNGYITFGASSSSNNTNGYYDAISATGTTYTGAVSGLGLDLIDQQAANTFTATWSNGGTTMTQTSANIVGNINNNNVYPAAVGSAISGVGLAANTVITNVAVNNSTGVITYTFSPAATASRSAKSVSFTSPSTSIITNLVTNGGTPNRKFYIEWINADAYDDNNSVHTSSNINFQIVLNENGGTNSNIINVNYGNISLGYDFYSVYYNSGAYQNGNTGIPTPQPAVGLRGSTTTDYNDRTGTTWASSTAGSANSSTITLSSANLPVLGLTYQWNPPAPCVAPSAQPTGLGLVLGTAAPSTEVDISYTAPTTAPSGYLIVRYAGTSPTVTAPTNGTTYTAGGALGTGTVVYVGTATTFANTGLTANTAYTYYVYDYNNTACSTIAYNTTSPINGNITTCLTAPVSSAATSVTPTGFTANWAASTGAVSYVLDVSTSSTFASFVTGYNALNVGNVTSYAVTGLANSTTYYFRVRAVGAAGCNSLNSGTQNTTTLAPTCVAPSAQPTGLGLVLGTAAPSTEVDISYTAPTTAPSGYLIVVYAGTSPTVTAPTNGTTYTAGGALGTGTVVYVGTATTFANTGLTANTAYTYYVYDYNNTACSIIAYNTTSPVNGSITTCLTAPVSSGATLVTQTGFTANWAASTGAASYVLDVSTSSTFASFVTGYNALNVGNVTSYAVTGLANSTTYYFRVRAVGAAGCNSLNSGTQNTTTLAPTCVAPSAQPTGLGLVLGTAAPSTEVDISYTAPTTAPSGYLIVRYAGTSPTVTAPTNGTTYTAGGALGTGTVVYVGTATTFANTGLTANTAYTYYVYDYNNTACSTIAYNTTSPINGNITTCLTAPVSSAATLVTPTGFTANWAASTGAASYVLDVSTSSTFASFVTGYNAFNVGNVTTYAVTGLANSTTYYYRVRSVGAAGCTSLSSATQNTTTLATPCVAPSAQPTGFSLVLGPTAPSTEVDISYTAPTTAPSGYLIVRYAGTAPTVTAPTNGTTYTAGGALGTGTVVYVGTATTFANTGLTANTAYTYYVYDYNNTACSTIAYNTTSPVNGSLTTCLTAPVSSAATSVTPTGFTANWAASTGAVSYVLDVSTSSTFASFVTGYNALNVGNVTTYAVTGLSSNATYYYRVRAIGAAGCNSLSSATQTLTTLCAPSPLTYSQGFNSTTIPTCWSQQNVTGNSPIQFVASSSHPTTAPQEGSDYVYWNSYNITAGNQTRLVSAPLTTSGVSSVNVSFYWDAENNTNYNSGAYLSEGVQVQYSTNGGSSWTNLGAFIPRHNAALTAGTSAWQLQTLTSTTIAGQSNILIGFLFTSEFGDNCSMDNLVIQATPIILTISDNGTQIGAQNLTIGSNNDTISRAKVVVQSGTTTVSSVSFSTLSNTNSDYTATDLSTGAFKLWYSSTSGNFSSALQIGTAQNAVGAGETITFSGLNLSLPVGTYYFWLTADINAGATSGHKITVSPQTASSFTASSGTTVSGGTSVTGTQTILPSCTTPVNPATIGSVTSTQTTISGTVGGTTATGYVVLFSTTSINPSLINGTTYTAGSAFNGTTTVGYVGTSANFTSTALTSNTNYYIYVFAYNSTTCAGGPLYSGYIQSSIYTCLAPPTGLNANPIGSTTTTVNWTASAGTITSYTVDVSLSTSFGAGNDIPGFPQSVTSGTTYNVTGLNVNTTYYYQITANIAPTNAGCGTTTQAANSSFKTVDATVATDYFQSNASGNWSAPGTWLSSHNGINFITATAAPTSSAKSVFITNTNTSTTGNYTAVVVTVDVPSTSGPLDIQATTGTTASSNTTNLIMKANLYVNGYVEIDGPTAYSNGTPNIDSLSVGNNTLTITGNLIFDGTYATGAQYRQARLSIGGASGVVNVAGSVNETKNSGADQIYFTGAGTNGKINVKGDWNFASSVLSNPPTSVILGNGTISFSGNTVQNINGFSTTTFPNLSDSNTTANLLVHGNINIVNTLNMIGANTHLIPDSSVIINSAAAAGTILGNGTIEATSNGLPSPNAPAASFIAQYKFSTYSLSNMTVNYTANGNQVVNSTSDLGGSSYGNLIINGGTTSQLDFGSGVKTLNGSLGNGTTNGVNGYVLIAAGSLNTNASNNYNITLGGNWTDNTGTTTGGFIPNAGTVYFNNTGTTLLTKQINGTATGQTFNNVSILNTTTGTTASSIAGSTGTLYLNGTMTIGSGSTLAAGTASNIYVGGNWSDNTATTAGGFAPGTGAYTVFFNGKAAQTIGGTATGQTFNNVTTSYPNTGTTSVSVTGSTTTLNVNGTMTLGATTLLTAGTATSINMAAGNWIDNTVSAVSGYGNGGFVPGTSTVYFKGIAPQTITGGTGNTVQTFNSITTRYAGSGTNSLSVTGNTATLNLLSNMTIGSTTAFAAGNASSIYVGKNWIDSTTAGGFTPGAVSNLVTFNGGVNTQTISGTATTQTFNNLSTSGTTTKVTVGSSTFGTSTSTLNINGTMTIGTGSSLVSGSANTINITGNWLDNTAGVTGGFTAGALNTVYFNGSIPQTITGGSTNTGQTFNNITVQNASGGSVAVSGTTGTLNLNSLLLSSGSLTAGTATTMNVAGNWTNNISSSAFTAGSGTVTFNGSSTFGSAAQLINGTSSTNFNTLNIQSGTSTTLGVSIGLTGNLIVSTGGTGSIFDMVTYLANNTSTGTMRVQGTGTLRLSGTTGGQSGSNFPTGFSSYTLTQSSTTEYYDATTGQTVTPITSYGNLTITGNSLKTAPAPLTIGNSLLINTGATFAAGNFTHTVAANWTNSGTFTAGSGTIIFNGGGGPNVIQGNLTGTNKFNYLIFNSNPSGGVWSFSNSADVAADFTLTSGSVTAPAGLLNVAGNWNNNGGSFTANGGTVSLNGSVAQAITGSQSTTFGTLDINNAVGLKDTLQIATSATTLSMTQGYIDVSKYSLTLSSPAAIAGASASSFVVTGNGSADGKLIVNNIPASSFTFPVGVDSLGIKFYYLPATIAPVAASSGLTWSAKVFTPVTPTAKYDDPAYSGAALSGIVNAEWVVEPTSTTTATAALTLNWVPQLEGSTFTTYINTYIGISHYQGTPGAGSWNPATQSTANHSGYTVTSTFTSFSPFGIGAINNPLPVILVDFNAVLNNNRTVGLTWTTQQEVNTAHFEVERSADGVVWTSIGTVQAVGNSSVPSNYDFTDPSPLIANFYRIKMVNINGAFGYTTSRFIKLMKVKEILVFPNPARNYVNVSVTKADVDLNVKLVNQIGQVLQVSQVKAGAGTVLTFDLHNYAQGTYFVQVSGSDGTMQTNKIIIMR